VYTAELLIGASQYALGCNAVGKESTVTIKGELICGLIDGAMSDDHAVFCNGAAGTE
jgi:hypothetical protein